MHPPEPIAIVGIGCLFPQSPDLQTYWRNILGARDCITGVPDDHSWSPDDYYDADPSTPDKTWCTRGGFLDKVPFDPVAFGIPPTHLESIDTTQLLGLIVARETLRDAGLDPDAADWDRDRVSVILGITGTQEMAITAGARLQGPIWRKAMLRCGIDPQLAEVVEQDIAAHFPTWTEQTFPGLLGNVVAGRIANRLDLGGTNCVVDAACASSLAAMQYAIGDLAAGRSDLVLTGGADTLNDIFMYECFTRTPAFTKSGDAKPFDATADGILIGEGIAITALKRLSDAERDGDRVYAVIKGLGSSSDGRYRSIYAPNPDGQAKALRRTYAMAGVKPETIELVEAHGTGTKAGDVAEVTALSTVFRESGREGRWVALGSVKSQIGHTKSTAGAAGLVKAALALHQRVLPPTAKIDAPNPKMAFDDSPFYLSGRARPWIRSADHPRRAAVSAFGFGGSNFHALLEEHGDPSDAASLSAPDSALFLLGADDDDGLRAALSAIDLDAASVHHAARATLEAWQPGRDRVLAFTAGSPDELVERIDIACARLDGAAAGPMDRVWIGGGEAPKVAFLFPGQGAQYVEMGRTVALRHPTVRAALDAADEIFRAAGRPPLSSRTFPPPAFDEATETAQAEALTATEWAQPAIGALSKGLHDLLRHFGVTPDAAAGHSYGELVALHAAGVLDAGALLEASRVRGEVMSASDRDRGTMAAVRGSLGAIQAVLDDLDADVVLANRNHPEQGVISGARDAIEQACDALFDAGLPCTPLRVAAAFHSDLVADARAPFAEALSTLAFCAPELPVIATATAAPYPADPDAARAMLADQIVKPVDWVGVVQRLADDGVTVFVECGPRGVLTGLTTKILGDDATVISLDRLADNEDGDTQLKWALAELAAAGVPVDPAPLLAERLPAAPRTASSAATVWLAGANVRFEDTLEPEMPSLPKAPAPPPSTGAEPDAADLGWAGVPSSGAPMDKPVHLERAESEPEPPPLPAKSSVPAAPSPAAGTVPAGDLAALLASTRETLSAFQSAQEKTAEVHARFLDATARANDNFARLFEAQTRLLELASTGQATLPAPAPRAPGPAPLPAAPMPSVEPVAPPVDAAPPLPSSDELFTGSGWDSADTGRVNLPDGRTTAVSDDLPPIFDAGAAVQQKSAPAPSAPAAPTASAPSATTRDQLVDAMLDAVAGKTGYPRETLELSMDLEADLGVDSIKRVEILSAVRDAVPALPELDNDAMAALRTLDEVVGYLDEAVGSTGAATATTGRSVPVTSGPSRETLVSAMLDAVAGKTGYPRETLELSMDLEADLGVDSIKRVEILSAVRDAVPALPELDNDAMAALRTLDEVVGYLDEAAGGSRELPDILKQKTGPTRDDLVEHLLAAVADKTGYPRDSLELSMDLEADLGVDSIKRVEILSAVRDRMPELPELDNDALAALRTLHEVVDHLCQVSAGLGFALIGGGATETAPALLVPPEPPPVTTAADPGLPPVQSASDLMPAVPTTLRRRPVELAPAPAGRPLQADGPWVLLADEGDRAAALAEVLRDRGVDVHVLSLAADGTPPDLPADLDGLVHLASIGATGDALASSVRGAFLAAHAAGPVRRLVTVSARGGRFGRDAATGDPLEGALAGLPKTAAHEWSDALPLVLDLHPDVSAEALADELLTDRGVREVGLSDAGAVTLSATDAEPTEAAEVPLSEGDLVVVTGGARGVTAHVVAELARRARPTLLLLGRSEVAEHDPVWAHGADDDELQARFVQHAKNEGDKATPKVIDAEVGTVLRAREIRATLDALRDAGAHAEYAAVDARDADAVAEVVARAVDAHGPVRGLLHGAGVLADKAIVDKTPEQFDRVFSTKVDGWRALYAAVDPAELRVVAMFTSVAGRFGNAGQCDYAMANEALVHHALAHAAAHPDCVVRSIDWGPWDGGMVTPSLRAHFHAKGHELIPLDAGARFFADEVSQPGPVEVVAEAPRPARGTMLRRIARTDPWVADHRIKDTPVVPAAMVLEWMTELAREVVPALRVQAVHDLAVLNGITIEGDHHCVELAWEPVEARDDRVVLSVEVREAEPGPLGVPRVHYRARVELGTAAAERQRAPEPNGLGRDSYPYALDEAYRRFLFHGPALRGIDEIVGISDHGAVAWLRTSTPAALGVSESRWETDPVAVDSVLQLMLLWVREKQGSAALPSALGEYRQYAPLTGRVACHLEMDGATEQRGRFTATLVDEDGDILATLSAGEYTADVALLPAFQHPA